MGIENASLRELVVASDSDFLVNATFDPPRPVCTYTRTFLMPRDFGSISSLSSEIGVAGGLKRVQLVYASLAVANVQQKSHRSVEVWPIDVDAESIKQQIANAKRLDIFNPLVSER